MLNNSRTKKSISPKRVYVGLSGGVDSAVSAALLVREGYDVTGVFIRIVLPGYPCSAISDRQEAMRVAAHLRIPFREIDLSKEYQARVFTHTLCEYARGSTPNPDTLCNREIKFGVFFDYCMQEGADFVATGHYARVVRHGTSTELHKGVDDAKDQSYFLWMVPEAHLAKTLFPVGDLTKPKVRALAQKFGLPNARRKDSQGLCFLGDISMHDMLSREMHPVPGDILSEHGQVIGRHDGSILYTVGQRHGFTVQSMGHAPQTPLFVIAKDIARNTVTVSEQRFPQSATKTRVNLSECNWIGTVRPEASMVRFRYRQTLMPVEILRFDHTTSVLIEEPHHVPIGQSLVVYQGARCLGGGVIEHADLV